MTKKAIFNLPSDKPDWRLPTIFGDLCSFREIYVSTKNVCEVMDKWFSVNTRARAAGVFKIVVADRIIPL